MLEFKQEAVWQVKAGRAASTVAATLAMPKASLTNWVRADVKGQLGAPSGGKATTPTVTPEQAEIARLRAQVPRLTMERDIAKKAALDSTRRCNICEIDGGLALRTDSEGIDDGAGQMVGSWRG